MEKQNMKKINLFKILALIIALIGVILILYVGYNKLKEYSAAKKEKEFENTLIVATKKYIKSNKEEFSTFVKVNDSTVITASELVLDNLLSSSLVSPNGTSIDNYYIKATINKDKTISYEVIG